MDEDLVILKMTCIECENADCKVGPRAISIDSLNGCTREVPEEVYDKYIHYMNEVLPFWHLYNLDYIDKSYFEIYNFLQEIYKKYPIKQKLDKKGKVIGG